MATRLIRNLAFQVFVAATALTASSLARGELIGLSSSTPGTVYRVDESTGAATALVDLTGASFTSLVGLEVLNGVVYATDVVDSSTGAFTFGTIDLATGAYTAINNQDGSINWHGLAANQAANLFYSVDLDASSSLVSVTTAGVVTTIGVTSQDIRGMAFDDNNGILYGVDGTTLYTIDVTTGAATAIGATGLGNSLPGLAYDNLTNVLYLNLADSNGGGSLYSLDVATGAATLIGPNGSTAGLGIDGLAVLNPVPEPTSLALVGLGGLLAVARRRRMRAA